jgi:outer membrane protein assembly factor BamB
VSDNIGLEEGMWASNFSISLRDGRAILVGSESHIGTDVGLFDLSKRALLWRLHLDHVHVSWNEPVLEGDDLVLSEDGLWVISLSKGVVRFHRDNPFLGVAPALVKGTLIFQTGSNKLTAVDVGSERVIWEAALPSDIVSDLVRFEGSVYVRVNGDGLLQISPADGKVVNSFSLGKR